MSYCRWSSGDVYMFHHCARGTEKMSISPEYIMTLIERIADLEQENTKREKLSIKHL